MSGYITTDVPGGQVTWYTHASLPPRRERMIQVEGMPLKGVIESIQNDTTYAVSREEAAAMFSLNELSVVVFLKSWTLTDAAGAPRPVPTVPDEVLDFDKDLYKALTEAAAKLYVNKTVESFTVDAIEDTASPIGDLGA